MCTFLHYQFTWGGYQALRWWLFDPAKTTVGELTCGKPLDVPPDYAHDDVRRVLLLPFGNVAEESRNEFVAVLAILVSSTVWGGACAVAFICLDAGVRSVWRRARGLRR